MAMLTGTAAKDTTIVMAPNAGHVVPFDEPELVNTTIRTWLDARRKK
jgi:carboxypeptidase C (cathepsin A)